MRLLVVTVGSLGDVLPFLSIADQMRSRGHTVEFCTNRRMAALVESTGLAFHPVGTERDAARAEEHPDLWHPIRGFGVLWRYLAAPALRPTFERIAWHIMRGGGPLTVLASPLALGARVAREKSSFNLVMGYTAPMNVRSVEDPMFLGAWRVPTWVPSAGRRLLWQGLDTWKLQPLVSPTLLSWRDELGLPRLSRSVFGQWMHEADRRMALFPDWFGSVPTTFGPIEHCAFPYWDGAQDLDDEAARFLSEGSAPIVIYPGSGARWVRPFVNVGLQVSRMLDRRAIILTKHASELPELDGRSEIHRNGLAFGRLFPKAHAVIHHGGVGTCAQALRAACPQIILPSAYDQFDNGVRISRLGCGASFVGWKNRTQLSAEIAVCLSEFNQEGFSRREDMSLKDAAMALEG